VTSCDNVITNTSVRLALIGHSSDRSKKEEAKRKEENKEEEEE
jgi:hypothetical protein